MEGDAVRLGFRDCPASQEGDVYTWFTGLSGEIDAALEAIVSAFDPQARCERVEAMGEELFAYRATIDRSRPVAPDVPELAIAKISTGAAFRFRVAKSRVTAQT
jgi:hypothetical protein